MIFSDDLQLEFLTLSAAVIVIALAYVKWKYTYWNRKGLDQLEPTFPCGNVWDNVLGKITMAEVLAEIYSKMKAKGRIHAGMYFFLAPIYLPFHPEIIKHIMQVDFDHFVDRGMYFNEKDDPLSAHLFSIEGAKWRNLRAKISPTFTSGKMKMMFPLVVKTSEELLGVLNSYASDEPVEMKDILARLTTDIIGTCAFGLDCNSLRDPNTEFRVHGRRFLQNTTAERLWIFLSIMFPGLMRYLGFRIIPDSVSEFFMRVVKDTIKYRENNVVKRNDFMQLLLQLKGDESDQNTSKLTTNELAAQAFVFYVAGFETSSTTMSFCLLELALNEDIQNNLREEINTVLEKHKGEFTYEAMMDMHYMEKVINETLRKHPPVASLSRICVKDYKIPETDITISKGTLVFIPVYAIHRDPEYFENPENFDPSRFDDENKQKRHPYSFLPFGDGPRICIGLRFGMMQTKVGLTVLLKNYRFKLNPQTQVPLKIDPANFLYSPLGGIWMNIEKICN